MVNILITIGCVYLGVFILKVLWQVFDHIMDLSPDKYYTPTIVNKIMWKLQGVKRP
jgi:hypothetical protein